MRKQSKQEKAADKRIERAYARSCSGVQIPMLAIPGIFRDARANMEARQLITGQPMTDAELDTCVAAIVETIRVR